ncbi:restriction endonuclease subunit S [Kingella negevensis]|uniref:restriction endonuclease subunit S n=1 Tax=Kingella negevensis TaxID=1522312 RepID=UPI002542755A|nr:restriction endonuclease subunit S [Kingella negevensis]WII93398.1 restriction endonuclease subunit S [Kingella negevensis]
MQVNRILDRFLQGEKVVWKSLGEVTQYEQPTKYLVASGDYKDSYKTPVLTAGKTFILGYTNEETGIYPASQNPVIIFDDFTTANKWVDFDFKAKSSAMKMITSKDETQYSLRYIYFWLNNLPNIGESSEHKRQWISNFAKKEIPIPPLHVQQKIADSLDQFSSLNTKLIAELAKEQALRAKQYTYYRDLLLNCEHPQNPFSGCDVQWKTLDKIAENLDAKRKPIKSTLRESGDIPYYGASGIVDYVKDYLFDGDYLLISEDGANLLARSTPIAFSVSGKSWVNNHAHVLKFDTYAERKFVEYYFNSIDLKDYISGVAQPKLNKQNLNSIPIPIPVPPLEIQTQIVAILDKFDDLATQINEALPREIQLRQKQYEYYREKLLDFHVSKQKAA